MNPRERLLRTLRGERADRVPLILERFHHANLDAVTDPGVREIAARVLEQTHFFHSVPTCGNRYLMTPTQCMREVARREVRDSVETTVEIETPNGTLTAVTGRNPQSDTTWHVKYPCESVAELEALASVPWELPPKLAPPDPTAVPPGFEQRGIVHTGVSSPFVCVAGAVPFELFLELCVTEFELMRELTAQCLERVLAVLDVVLAGEYVEYVWMGGCEWLTPPMGSPRLYDELVHAFEAPVIERIHAAGALSHVHCHGNVRSTLERVIERGADFLEPVEPPPDGDITFAEAKALAAGRITLGGNVEARVLENEDAAAVEAATRAAFAGGRERMVLQTTAGPIAAMSPRVVANYHRLIDVWEECSPL